MQEKKGPSGLLVGLLIGGAVGALLSTKKGRKILKDVAEYGLDYIGNTVSMEDISTIFNDEQEEMMSGEVEDIPQANHKSEEKIVTHLESRRRRLFKGIGKK